MQGGRFYGTIPTEFLLNLRHTFGGRKKPGFIPKADFNCQSQPKGFNMRLTEEQIEQTEESLRNYKVRLPDTATLKKILRDGLVALEKAFNELPTTNREGVRKP